MKMSPEHSRRAAGRLSGEGWYGTVGLVALFSIGAVVESLKLGSLRNPVLWGHLRMGMWILENGSAPHSGVFSQAANLGWRDFSWGYEAIAAIAYKMVGLRALPLLEMVFRVMATTVLFFLAAGRSGRAAGAAGLAVVGLYVLSGMGPASTSASVIFFGMALWLLVRWREGRGSGVTFALPLLFLVWANLDIGFVYGVSAWGLFLVTLCVEHFARRRQAQITLPEGQIRFRSALALCAACLAASLITPNGYYSYAAAWQGWTSRSNLYIPGYSAMGFRQVLDYVLLLLGMGAFLAMGLRRSRDIFLMVLLCASAASAFHSQREAWLLVVSSTAVIGKMAASPNSAETQRTEAPWSGDRKWGAIALFTLAAVTISFLVLVPRESNVLMERVAETFPVRASDYIRNEQLPQPLFNAYEWGAFLTWYLPEYPVAIDGRRGLYREELETDYFKVMKVDLPFQSLPAMKDARTILLEKSNVVANGLRNVPGFRVAYEDDLAIVLVQGAKE